MLSYFQIFSATLFVFVVAAPEPKAKPYFGYSAPVFPDYSELTPRVPLVLPLAQAVLPINFPVNLPSTANFPVNLYSTANFPVNFHSSLAAAVPVRFTGGLHAAAHHRPSYAAPFHHRSIYSAIHPSVCHH